MADILWKHALNMVLCVWRIIIKILCVCTLSMVGLWMEVKTWLIQTWPSTNCLHQHNRVCIQASCVLASSPGPFKKSEKRAWYPLFAHALNFPTFWEFQIIPCYPRVPWRQIRVFCHIFNRILLTMAICVQGLDSAVLYDFLRLRDEAMTLKHDKKASVKHLYLGLMGFGKL